MPTLRDDMMLSLAVYDETASTAGWTRVGKDSNDDSGFNAAAYQKGNEIVIAFRGWDNFDPSDVPNIDAAYRGNPFQQIGDAQKFVDAIEKAHPNASISVTGHSLGAGIAGVTAVRNDLKAVVFASIENVDAAHNSMDGYNYDPFGVSLWKIPPADFNRNISRAALSSYGDVINYAVFGEVASFNDHTVLRANQIGVDRFIGRFFENGIRHDDSKFGRYTNTSGDEFNAVVPAHITHAPYSAAFSTAIHAMGFHALTIVFGADLAALAPDLPRLAFQLTNDRLATDATGGGNFEATYDFLDALMLDDLNHGPKAHTTATGMIQDFKDIAGAGANSTALANADINTAILQLAIQYASTQTLGASPDHKVSGLISAGPEVLSMALSGGPWGSVFAEGTHLIRHYADFLLGDAASQVGSIVSNARHLIVEANNGQGIAANGFGPSGDMMFGGSAGDTLVPLGGRDIAFGLDGDDSIYGGARQDVLVGGFGNDMLSGGGGNDVLIGGRGSDDMSGGPGADRFVFTTFAQSSTVDHIFSFAARFDTLVFDNNAFAALGNKGPLDADAFHIGPVAEDAQDRLIYRSNTGALLYDHDGAGGDAAVRIAMLDPHLHLTSDNFLII